MPTIQEFRDLCHRHGLAATHQRQVIFEAVMALHGMTEEAILAAVRLASVVHGLATVFDAESVVTALPVTA